MLSFACLNVKGCVARCGAVRYDRNIEIVFYFVSVLKLVSIALWCFLSIGSF